MKKALSILLLTGMFVTTTGSVFASESNSNLETDLPYVEGLGYEVNLDIEEQGVNPKLQYVKDLGFEVYLDNHNNDVVLYGYDSGWKDFLGGRWRHGVNNTQVWSKFDHNRKVHKTTVRGAGGKYSYSGWTNPGLRASASWEKAESGNKAWADVK